MMNNNTRKLTLDRLAVYQIIVPGHLVKSGLDWVGEMEVDNSLDEAGLPITILTGSLDQAALIGLLRRLYSRGLPLISVTCLEVT